MKYIAIGLQAVRRTILSYILVAVVPQIFAQNSPNAAAQNANSDPDILLFNDGEKLIGQLERVVGTSVTFKSDMAGEITVDASKIKELHSPRKFAVIGKDVTLGKHESRAAIPQGPVAIADQKVSVRAPSPAPERTIPLASTSYVVDESTFTKNLLSHPGFFEDWKG